MNIHVLEMPLDFGASRHGSDMGPSAIRLAGLREKLVALGHTAAKYYSPMSIHPQEFENPGNPKAKYLAPIVKACTQLATQVEKAADKGEFPLILGGDHSVVLGSLAGLSASYKKKGRKVGVLYVDAHGDFNTCDITLSGNIHGMCLSASCGYGIPELTQLYNPETKIDPENVCFVGLRDVDMKERELMKQAGVRAYTMSDIDRKGINAIITEVKQFFAERVDVVHLSFDLDAIDPRYCPGVGIQVPGGLSSREALLLVEEMSDTGMVCSADFVEVNPTLDVQNQTAKMTVQLIARLLGDRLY